MMKNYKLRTRLALAITCCMVAFSINVKAQLTGTKNIPGDYPTLAAAITDLNTQGVGAGGVTLNLVAGNPETAPAGGYVIGDAGSMVLTTASASNPIIIEGNNNTITAAAAPTAGSRTDAIFKIIGGDYITLRDFTMVENAANTTGGAIGVQQMTEFGVALFAVSATDGAQFNSILNNTITLSSATAYQNAIGIFSTNASSATNSTQAASSSAGTNSNNKFYNNTISGVAYGMYFISPPQTATVTETGNDIGGTSAATGNHITFGVSTTTPDLGFTSFSGATVAGIYYRNVVGFTTRYNTINTASGATLAMGGVFSGAGTPPAGITYTTTISDNNITMTNTGTTATTGIDFGSGISTATLVANNNTVVLNQTATAATSGAVFGIKANYSTAANTATNNSVTINQSETTGALSGNATAISLAASSTTLTGSNNTIYFNQNGSGTGTLTGNLVGLDVNGSTTNTNVLTNSITFNQTTAVASGFSGNVIGIRATGAASNALNITTNNVITVKQAVTGSGTYGSGNVSFITYNASHNNVNITGNTFNTTGSTIRSTGSMDVVLGGGTTISGLTTIKNNTAVIDRVAGSGAIGFFTQTSTLPNDPYDSISGNTITFTGLTGTTSVTVINRVGGSTGAVKNVCNNIISVSGTNTGTVIGIVSSYSTNTLISGNSITVNTASATINGIATPSGTPGTSVVRSNTFSLISSNTAPSSMIAVNTTAGGPYTINNNTFSAMNFTGVITGSVTQTGIVMNGSATGNAINNNVITNISAGAAGSTATTTVDGILVSGSTVNVFKNKIYGLTSASTATGSMVDGIRISGGITNIYNNYIGSLTSPASASTDAIRGINISSTSATSPRNIYYNTIYLNATSTGANFGTTGIFAITSTNANNAKLDLRNNIIINNSTPAGTGLTVAYRRSSTTLTNFASTSNNNLFYAGTPGASNLIFSDGTAAAQTLAAYQAIVGATIDAASKTENVSFQSTTGSASNYLHVNTATATYAESSAANIATYTDDYDGDIRQGNTGYTGTGTAPDIGADEFEGTSALPLCSSVTAGTATATVAAVCPGGNTSISVTGATSNSTSAGITYQWVKSTSATGPYTAIGGATSTTLATTGALAVTTYFKFVVACSNSGLTDSTAAVTITVYPAPAIVVNPTSATICQPGASAVAISATGASTYAWTPSAGLSATTGSSVNATPSATTTYTVTGTDGNGCTGTGTSTITVNSAVVGLTATATPSSVCSGGNSQLLANGSVASTLSAYQFSTSTGATLDPMTGATNLIGSGTDDTPMGSPAAIGFSFLFNGVNYTQFSVAPDGWILLGGATASSEYTNAVTSTSNIPRIYPYWDDLATGTNGSVTSVVTGTAPNRILKIQWFVTVPRATTGAANATFQAWLYEGNGRIEFRYGAMATTTGSSSTGITASATAYRSVTYATNSASASVANDTNSIVPANGRMYIFTPAPISSYTWSPSTFITGQETLANPLATAVTATTTYTVTASSGGCSSTASVTVTAGAPLTTTASVTPGSTVCAGTNLTLNATPTGGGLPYTYAWAGPNSFTSTSQNPTITAATPAATGTYTVTVSDNCSATTTATVTVTVNALPAVAVTPATGLYCSPGTGVTLTASMATTYAWLPAAGLSATGGASVVATPSATTTYTVTGTDGNGCSATATATITSAPAVTGAAATASPAAICAGSTTTLGATGAPYSITILTENFNGTAAGWTTVNNSTGGTPANAAWTLRPDGYATGGIWGATMHSNDNTQFYLTNSDAQGSSSTTRTMLQSPSMNTVGLASLSLQFYNYWRFNATPDSGNVEVSTNGTSWTLVDATTATTGGPSSFVQKTVNLNAYVGNPTLYIRFRYQGNWGYGWAIDNVTVTGGASTFTYSWASSPAGFSSTVQNPTDAPAATTDYTVTLSNIYGCTATATTNVVVNPVPAAPTASGATICAGSTAALTATGTGTIGWYNAAAAGTFVAGGPSFTTPALTATATYYVQDSSAAGCVSARTPVMVNVNALPNVTASADMSTVCAGGTITLTGSGATSYTWDNGATDGVEFAPASTTTYHVTGTDANGCTNTDSVTVTVNALPTVTASADMSAVCTGGMVTLTGSGATTYTWDNSVTDGVAFTPASTTTYHVTGTDANGCMNMDSVMVTVNPLPNVTASADMSTVCAGGTVTLTGSGATTYTWDNGATDGVEFAPASTTTYHVTGTDANGCMNTDSVTVTVNPVPTVTFAPITPGMICDNASAITLTGGAPAGGVYSGTGVSGGMFDPAVAGDGTFVITYTVTDTNTCAGTDTASIMVSNCTGIAGNTAATIQDIVVYPNPASGVVNIVIDNANFTQLLISIMDVQGKQVYNELDKNVSAAYKKEINVEGFAKGVYYIRMTSGSDTKVQKLVIQ